MLENFTDNNGVEFDYGNLKWVRIIEKKEREIYCEWLPYMVVDIYKLWKQYAPKEERLTINEALEIIDAGNVTFTDKEKDYIINRAIYILNQVKK